MTSQADESVPTDQDDFIFNNFGGHATSFPISPASALLYKTSNSPIDRIKVVKSKNVLANLEHYQTYREMKKYMADHRSSLTKMQVFQRDHGLLNGF